MPILYFKFDFSEQNTHFSISFTVILYCIMYYVVIGAGLSLT